LSNVVEADTGSLLGNESEPAEDIWGEYCWLNDNCSGSAANASTGDKSASAGEASALGMMMIYK